MLALHQKAIERAIRVGYEAVRCAGYVVLERAHSDVLTDRSSAQNLGITCEPRFQAMARQVHPLVRRRRYSEDPVV